MLFASHLVYFVLRRHAGRFPDTVVVTATLSPAVDEQVSRVHLQVHQLHAQMERLVFSRLPSPPHQLLAPHVVKHMQLKRKRRS